MRAGSIYMLTNRATGDTYIGMTTQDVADRWREHTYRANGVNCRTWLHRAIRKYGAGAFSVTEIASAFTQEALAASEIEIIRDRHPTYNQSHGGEGTAGRKFSPDVVALRNAKLRGLTKSPEARARISSGCKAAMTPERREQVVARLETARLLVDEKKRVAAVRKASSGRVWSEESRAKLSASCMGRRYSDEVINRMRRSKMRPVVCVTNGQQYDNAKEAAQSLGVGHRSVIRVLKGEYPSVKGLAFNYGV